MIRKILSVLLLGLVTATANAQSFNQRAVVSGSSSGDNTLIAAVSTQQIYIYGLDLVLASSGALILKCGSTALTGAMTLTSYSKQVIADTPYWVCPLNTAFVGNLGSGIQMSGAIWYRQQ